MSGIFFGSFRCAGGSYNKKKNEYRLKFEDEVGNKLSVKVDEATFRAIQVGDPLPWKLVRHQTTLPEAGS